MVKCYRKSVNGRYFTDANMQITSRAYCYPSRGMDNALL